MQITGYTTMGSTITIGAIGAGVVVLAGFGLVEFAGFVALAGFGAVAFAGFVALTAGAV